MWAFEVVKTDIPEVICAPALEVGETCPEAPEPEGKRFMGLALMQAAMG